MNLLLFSNSTNAGEPYFSYPLPYIRQFLGAKPLQALFIPYAAVTFSFDEYEAKVKERFLSIGHDLISIHHFNNPMEAVENAEVIVTGGGNTFHLLRLLQQNKLIEPIRKKVLNGTPYIGWSAGSNVTCPTICTTNDMPIVEPNGFKAFNLLPFQINPHYTDIVPHGFAGETRDQRIAEYLAANPAISVVGLREGTLFRYENGKLGLQGPYKAKIFKAGEPAFELSESDSFQFLMN
ncbi:MAG TPA: dipeptidase PepE [Bacteroidales bacterium]|nr:dipeptidase PepE [Bacteroidales bacterium]